MHEANPLTRLFAIDDKNFSTSPHPTYETALPTPIQTTVVDIHPSHTHALMDYMSTDYFRDQIPSIKQFLEEMEGKVTADKKRSALRAYILEGFGYSIIKKQKPYAVVTSPQETRHIFSQPSLANWLRTIEHVQPDGLLVRKEGDQSIISGVIDYTGINDFNSIMNDKQIMQYTSYRVRETLTADDNPAWMKEFGEIIAGFYPQLPPLLTIARDNFEVVIPVPSTKKIPNRFTMNGREVQLPQLPITPSELERVSRAFLNAFSPTA